MRGAKNDRALARYRAAAQALGELRKDLSAAAQIAQARLAHEDLVRKERLVVALAALKEGNTAGTRDALADIEPEGGVH